MDRILLNILVPAVNEVFDIFAPINIPISEVITVLAEGVADLAKGRYHVSGREMLMAVDMDMLMQPDYTLEQYGIQDGDKLIML